MSLESSPSSSPSRARPIALTVGGLAAVGVLLAVSACSNNAPGTPAAGGTSSTAPSTSAAPPAGGKHHPHGVAGKITAENGDTWTVVNARGKQFTVDITPQTMFGTKKAPATEQQFTVGTQVRAIGTMSNATVTATRIAMAPAPGSAPASTPTAPSATNGG